MPRKNKHRKTKSVLKSKKHLRRGLLFTADMLIGFSAIFIYLQFLQSSTATYPYILTPTGIITHGSRNKKEIALTFDADMTEGMRQEYLSGEVKSWYDPKIVKILNKTKTKATFFLTGMWMELYPEETQGFAINPLFELSNHSYDHPSFNGSCYGLPQVFGDQNKKDEIIRTQEILKSYGVDNKYFRFPGGCYSERDIKLVQSLGMQVVHWDVISGDAFSQDTEAIENNVINHVQNGSIAIFHLNGAPNAPKTAEALPVIIDVLKKKGYKFVKVSELL